MNVVGTDAGEGVRLVAVHVNKALEAVLLAAVKEPVDGAFLVGLHMVSVETADEVIANNLTGSPPAPQSISDKLEILLQRVLAIDHFHKLDEAAHNVIVEVFVIADGDNGIRVRQDGLVLAVVPFATGVDKALHVKGITAKHTAYGVGDKGFYHIFLGEDVVIPLHGVGDFFFCVVDTCNGYILVGDFWGKFVAKTVNINEDTIKLLFIGFELIETGIAILCPSEIGIFDTLIFCHEHPSGFAAPPPCEGN